MGRKNSSHASDIEDEESDVAKIINIGLNGS